MARQQFEDNRKVPRPPPQDKTWIYEHDATAMNQNWASN